MAALCAVGRGDIDRRRGLWSEFAGVASKLSPWNSSVCQSIKVVTDSQLRDGQLALLYNMEMADPILPEDLPFRHYTLKHRLIAWISTHLFDTRTYTVRHGLLKGMKRKGGLGWVPTMFSSGVVTAEDGSLIKYLDSWSHVQRFRFSQFQRNPAQRLIAMWNVLEHSSWHRFY